METERSGVGPDRMLDSTDGEHLAVGPAQVPETPVDTERRLSPKVVRRLVILGAVVGLVALSWSGALDTVTDEEQLQSMVDDAGIWGPVLFSLLFTALVPVGVPGLVFVLPAAVVFSPPVAVAVSLLGGYGSSGIGMWFARTIGRDRVTAKLPPRFAAWNEHLARRGLLAVIGLRVVTYLAAPADWLLGITNISTRHLIVGTAIGLIPPTVMYVYVGGGILDLVL